MGIRYVLLLFTVVLCTSLAYTATLPPCDQPVDLVFVLDTSRSIWLPDFKRQLKFVEDVVKQFHVGQGNVQTRIGVVTFAHSYWPIFHLRDYHRMSSILSAIRRIKHKIGYKTHTDKVLRYVRDRMFTHAYGSRRNAYHIAVVITDGKSTHRKRTIEDAAKARESGIDIFGIGVGGGVDFNELADIASQPTTDYMFEVEDFRSLDAFTDTLARRACGVIHGQQPEPTLPPKPEPTTRMPPPAPTVKSKEPDLETTKRRPIPRPFPPQPSPQTEADSPEQSDIDPSLIVSNCGGKPADIYFVLDSSNSVWPEDFRKQLKFVKDLVSLFDVSDEKTRVGVVTFSDTVNPMISFDDVQEKRSIIKQISNITFLSGRTNTAEALKFIREQGFSRDVARREVAHIMLLFTDGLSKNPYTTARQAELARKDGIYVFAIGIGMSVDRKELRDIASDPDDNFVFHVSNFSVLNTIKEILAIKTCAIQADGLSDQATSACKTLQPTDMMFVYDSAQLGMKKTQMITKFVSDITNSLERNSGKLRVGRLTENCLRRADAYLSSHQSSMSYNNIEFPDFKGIIDRLVDIGFSERYGARRWSQKVAVVFLDDDMGDLNAAATKIQQLREANNFVVTIGDIDPQIAARFGSKPANDYLVHIPSYKYLTTAKSTLLQKLCQVLSRETVPN